ncbi:winged helix-turn-helix domain-containing protein [Streptomyces sp. MA25(2023)]|nr:winged helix-turn-helix domain-containing protein [Streptomyces sp. MA25(2023)]MDN3257591.1 winged helix-turn-helix domain-containing protein [Streptomyces sp. MA25(2023)]
MFWTVEGIWRLLKRHGWSWQQPAQRAAGADLHRPALRDANADDRGLG